VAEKLLVVDDDATYRARLVRAFEGRGFLVHAAGDVKPAIAIAEAMRPGFAVIDLKLPGGSGLSVLDALGPETNAVILTGYGSIATAVEAMRRGATSFLPKPADVEDLLVAFARGRAASTGPPMRLEETPSLARAEWEHIQRVLSDCNNNISQAARVLRIERRSLQRKLSKYPVSK